MNEEGILVTYAGLKIPLESFNEWIRTPISLSRTIARLKTLERQLLEQRTKIAGEQALMRQLTKQEVRP